MKADRVVICMKWGALYPAAYVNVLYSAVCKNITGPFRFVCLTNEHQGLAEGIEYFPLPDLELDQQYYDHGAWPKLGVLQKDLYGLTGRCLFIDLDSVILQSLDPFFERSGHFISIAGGPDWGPGNPNPNPHLATGVFAFDLGTLDYVFEAFMADKQAGLASVQNEQQFIQKWVREWTTWQNDWVISFKRHLRRPVLIDRFLPPRRPDANARILAFHGDPRPIEVVRSGQKNWAKFPHYGRGPVDWIRAYWLENGYDDKD